MALDKKGKLPIKAKFFPPACLKQNLDKRCHEVEHDLVEMHMEQYTVSTYKLFVNEKSLKNKEDIRGEIDPNLHNEEETEKIRQDPNCWKGYLLKKDQCHNVLFGSYCKDKVMRYADLYPNAMNCKSAEDMFLQKYQFTQNNFLPLS